MVKRFKLDESGDSDDLQSLFDEIAGAAESKPRLEVVNEAPASGDNPDLEALFDSVSAASMASDRAEAGNDPCAAPVTQADAHHCDAVFNRVGTMARQLHDTLRELGYDKTLQNAAQQIPDARQRLSYIAQMTEQAASRVLNATDVAQPLVDEAEKRAAGLGARWDKLYANALSVDEFKALAGDTRAFLTEVPTQTRAINAQLLEIVMAQDFQDLTGQVIKKIVDLAQQLETQLVQVLIESMPDERKASAGDGLLNGPVINAAGRTDVVANQEQVDELLESLGF